MFSNLCGCHKNKKKNSDEDDLPYSPKKSTSFFGLKKNSIFDKTLHSTPNQLVQIKKINDDLDVKNNNNYSSNLSTENNRNSIIINSPIEMINSNYHNLDSNDESNQFNKDNQISELNNRTSFNKDNQLNESNQLNRSSFNEDNQLNRSYDRENQLNELNDKFSKLRSDNELINLKLYKNNSSNDLSNQSSNNLRSNSSTNLTNLPHSNSVITSKPKPSFFDSTDSITKDSMNIRNSFNKLIDDQNIIDNNINIKINDLNYNDNELNNKQLKDELEDNPINDLINIPKNTNSLKRVSSIDKLSLDNSSIDSVILDKQSNEIIRKSSHFNTNYDNNSQNLTSNQQQHPNSIIIQETITLTLKRDKNDKNSLNEFSIENVPKQLFESSSFAREYFYDEPIIKTSSKFFESDLATYKMQSDPRGLCLIINNATINKPCLLLKNGFSKEVNYSKDLFTKLGFNVEIYNNIKANAILKLMKKLKHREDFLKHDAFVCIYFGHGNQNYVIGEDKFKINLEIMIGAMNNYHCPNLIDKPKIFIIHTCNSTCDIFLEPIPPSNIPREVQALKKIANFKIIPTWTDTVIIYSVFVNSQQLHYSSFIKEFGLAICENAFEFSLHDILLKANNQIFKKNQDGFNFIYRGFNKDLFFNPGHFINDNQ